VSTGHLPVLPLGDEHREQAWLLSRLAFGGDPDASPQPSTEPPRAGAWDVLACCPTCST
jgi:hypothetical protein